MLGQAEGRTADDAAYWLAGATPAWRDAVQVVAIDMCTIYLSAVRRMLPHAAVAVDLFHVVQLAVKTAGDVRRRAIREIYGRRGKSGDPEYGIKHLLERNVESLSPDDLAKIIETLDASAEGQQAALAWIAKEKLRDVLKLRARVTGSVPCERQVRGRLFAFYDWCAQHEDIPELVTLARTVSRWEDEITAAVITGVTNATSESLNRLAKLEARMAYGFRNPANQRRRVRTACTRGTRRQTAAGMNRASGTPGNARDNTQSNRPQTPPRLTSKTRQPQLPEVSATAGISAQMGHQRTTGSGGTTTQSSRSRLRSHFGHTWHMACGSRSPGRHDHGTAQAGVLRRVAPAHRKVRHPDPGEGTRQACHHPACPRLIIEAAVTGPGRGRFMIMGQNGRYLPETTHDHDRRPECLNVELRHIG